MPSFNSTAAHTAGPWRFLEDDYGDTASGPLTIGDSANNDLANIYSRDDATVDIPREQAIANAHLIAAAPDLLSNLDQLCRSYVSLIEIGRYRIVSLGGDCDPVERMVAGDPVLSAARAAIAAAKGGTP